MSQPIDLLTHWGTAPYAPVSDKLPVLRLERNQIPIGLFTKNIVPVALHYCEEREPKGYVHCNGEGCVLCLAGKSVEQRALLPAYVPSRRTVEILAISPNSNPGALRPQILPLIEEMAESSTPVFALVSKSDRTTYKVARVQMGPQHDTGKSVFEDFLKRWEAGQIDPAKVFPQLDNAALASIPGIATMLQFKEVTGGKPSDNDQRE